MRIREIRKEYLTSQALSYIVAGLFLISYTNVVQAREFIFAVGITLCVISFIDVLVITFLTKFIRTIERIDSYAKILILPITFLAMFLSIPNTRDMGFVELRLVIFVSWSLLIVLSMGVSGFKVMSKYIKGITDTKGFLYKLFVYLGGLSLAMGWFLMLYGFFDPKSTELMISFNKLLYDPMLWFAIATLCVFPILILTPNDDEDNESE